MPRSFGNWGYAIALVIVLAFFASWKFVLSPDRLAGSPLYQKTLDITAANISRPPDDPDESLRIYAVNVVHTPPFKDAFFGYGIYLGQGAILTASHVVGRWPAYATPHIIVAGKDLPAKVIKQGAVDQTDLALLVIDQTQLPVSLQLRRNPICKGPLHIGANVIVAYPERIARSRVMSPLLISPEYRSRFATLIEDAQGSGSGVFDVERHCFLGIMSQRITKFTFQNEGPFRLAKPNGWAGYFVPATAIPKL